MSWWRPFKPQRSDDDEIAARIAAEVEAGRIAPAFAHMFEKALRDEQAGKGT